MPSVTAITVSPSAALIVTAGTRRIAIMSDDYRVVCVVNPSTGTRLVVYPFTMSKRFLLAAYDRFMSGKRPDADSPEDRYVVPMIPNAHVYRKFHRALDRAWHKWYAHRRLWQVWRRRRWVTWRTLLRWANKEAV